MNTISLPEAKGRSALKRKLAAGLKRVLVAAVGPVVAKELAGYGVLDPLVPARAFAMKPLVLEISKAIAARK